MRRKGRVTGYVCDRSGDSRAAREQAERELEALGYSGPFKLADTHPRIKILNKPTNQSKLSGRCGLAGCRNCHEHPVSKALFKTKGRNKLNCLLSRRIGRTHDIHIHPSDPFYMDAYDEYDLSFDEHIDDDDYDEDVHASDLGENLQHEVRCDNHHFSSDGLLHGVDIDHPGACGDQQGSQSAPLAICNEVSDAIQACSNIQVDGFVVANDDYVQDPYASVAVLSHISHAMNGGSIEWTQFAEDSDDEDDDWLLC